MVTLQVNDTLYSDLILIGDKSQKQEKLSKTSLIYTNQNRTLFFKKVYRFLSYDILKREVYWLQTLQDTGIVPKLIDVDFQRNIMVMEYVGEPVSFDNFPHDYYDQMEEILKCFRKNNCQHNDIKEGEILVGNNGKIYLCDFGMASSVNEDFSIGKKFNSSIPSKFIIKDDQIQMSKIGRKFKILKN